MFDSNDGNGDSWKEKKEANDWTNSMIQNNNNTITK